MVDAESEPPTDASTQVRVITIRTATQPDIPHLADLVRQQVVYQLQFGSHLILNPKADWVKYVYARLQRRDAEVLVADKDGTLVGYIDIRIIQQGATSMAGRLKTALRRLANPFHNDVAPVFLPRRYGFIEDIYVAPSLRNSPVGVGVRLWRSSLPWFELKRVSHIECSIAARNGASQTFLRKLGFKTAAVLLSKDLSDERSSLTTHRLRE